MDADGVGFDPELVWTKDGGVFIETPHAIAVHGRSGLLQLWSIMLYKGSTWHVMRQKYVTEVIVLSPDTRQRMTYLIPDGVMSDPLLRQSQDPKLAFCALMAHLWVRAEKDT
jgi:hypothetical protein